MELPGSSGALKVHCHHAPPWRRFLPMRSRVEVAWSTRLLAALCSLIFTLVLALVLIVLRDFHREAKLEWFNGGEIQVVGYALIMGGLVLLATYVAFVVPLVLLWPARSQRRRWYAVLGVSMLWPPLLYGMILRHEEPPALLDEIRHYPGLFEWLELFALCSCGCYLLLIRWQHRRIRRDRSGLL